ncbi:hypothetical protein [Pimelobacter sp. 30-1]|uniref:hypothetical protein n=1 Tax=Pimelobacter sp. 30-1 TaxID=2004991 RepID=UPI001C04830E|nr:hypothetical protein [Pimelobacter sp. 30-1]MBU2696725.1 hypothetical protein [Pimelobacter sp. 30-1]
MPASPAPVSRRLLVAGGLGGAALALSGCDLLDDVLGREDDPGVSGSPSGAVTPTAPAEDADSTLVEDVVTAISATSALVAATTTAVPALAKTTATLTRLHAAHVAELGATITAPATPPAASGPRPAALRRLLRAEADLQTRLVGAAQQAQSGALAQLFAAMAAAIAQQRAVLG